MLMIEHFFNATLIENAINRALSLDPQAQEKLSKLNERHIGIQLDFTATPWIFKVEDGALRFSDAPFNDCDVRLSGTLGGFLHLFRGQEEKRNENDKLYIEGDLHTAQQFQRVMGSLSPDFEAALNRRLGDKLGSAAISAWQQMRYQGEIAKEKAESVLREWLVGEQGIGVNREVFTQYQQQMNTLDERLQRLEARFKQLENQLRERG
ncbi:Uncharacterized protein conserved in bacteria [Suttonella ornithocola]|uniref:Uncharacterized protein conserved in bacteria n=2 Tax=Suttonella ornithocola TaxID=279832 RepID=A0A380MPR6_9GAMM|nr:Uncharacterized protein conserved in bacteria [Suttonella ornithocola]